MKKTLNDLPADCLRSVALFSTNPLLLARVNGKTHDSFFGNGSEWYWQNRLHLDFGISEKDIRQTWKNTYIHAYRESRPSFLVFGIPHFHKQFGNYIHELKQYTRENQIGEKRVISHHHITFDCQKWINDCGIEIFNSLVPNSLRSTYKDAYKYTQWQHQFYFVLKFRVHSKKAKKLLTQKKYDSLLRMVSMMLPHTHSSWFNVSMLSDEDVEVMYNQPFDPVKQKKNCPIL